MPYYLSAQNLSSGQIIQVAGAEARHILLSHRIKKGEKIKLQDPNRERYLVDIIDTDRYLLKCKVLEKISVPEESSVKISVFQSVVSEKALDFIFQKGTELGVSKIVLFNSKNTAAKLLPDKFKSKHERWNKILIESAKQCERAVWPSLEFVSGVEEVLSQARNLGKVFLTDISGDKVLALSPIPLALGLVVGPEGGFTPEEIGKFKSLPNLQTISLGPLFLRAETAALASLAIVRSAI